ncbi:MAG TPA: hypothetical protein VK524_11005, partial [Polyangiaceae bacterium]|nr:hypothetical protein [Polyangiaceae bacterium]
SHAVGDTKRALKWSLAMLPVSMLVAGCVLFSFTHRWQPEGSVSVRMLAAAAACLAALALSSVPVFVEMRRAPRQVHGIYAASLLGGALGVPIAFGLVHWLGDVWAYVAVLAGCVPGVVLLASSEARRYAAALCLVASLIGAFSFDRLDRAAHPRAIHRQTNAVSRIDVTRHSSGGLSIRTAGINAGTSTAPPNDRSGLLRELSALPFGKDQRALVLGSGAGRNVVQALSLGAREVIAVEINRMIPEYLNSALPAVENPYRDPRVQLIVAEGREAAAQFARERARGGPSFDLVYVPIATLFGSSGHALTQTYLMTEDAFELYFRLLSERGVVAVYFSNVVRPKILQAMATALRNRGARNVHENIVVFSESGHFAALARASAPFTRGEIEQFAARTSARALRSAQNLERGQQQIALTDDNPFLYNDRGRLRGKRQYFDHLPSFVGTLLFSACALLVLSIAATVFVGRAQRSVGRAGGYAVAFAAMGVAYTLFQTALLQRLAFLLAHPVIATAVVLPCTLLGTGLGAHWSRGWHPPRYSAWRLSTTAMLIGMMLLIGWAEPSWFIRPEWPYTARVLLGAATSLAPFLIMGTYFPAVFARVEREAPRLTAWCWLVNGIAAVMGSMLVIYSSMHVGFSATVLIAVALYALLAIWDVTSRRTESQALAPAAKRGRKLSMLGWSSWCVGPSQRGE